MESNPKKVNVGDRKGHLAAKQDAKLRGPAQGIDVEYKYFVMNYVTISSIGSLVCINRLMADSM